MHVNKVWDYIASKLNGKNNLQQIRIYIYWPFKEDPLKSSFSLHVMSKKNADCGIFQRLAHFWFDVFGIFIKSFYRSNRKVSWGQQT